MNEGKKPLLQTIGREMAITAHGLDNIPEGPNVFVANHACMRDIFAIPASLPEDCDIVISSRLAYKNSSVDTAIGYRKCTTHHTARSARWQRIFRSRTQNGQTSIA